MKSDLCDVEMVWFAETPKAILVGETMDEKTAIWLPKSQCEIEVIAEGPRGKRIVEVTLPEWLAMEKGLI